MKRDRDRDRDRGRDQEKGSYSGKGKSWIAEEEEEKDDQPDAGMDELLAVLGYKVKSSDMAEVAQKLEQLEMAMGTSMEDGISHLSSDTVHKNPSDLSGWVQSMLSELNCNSISTNFDMGSGENELVVSAAASGGGSCSTIIDFSRNEEKKTTIFDDDLRAIPGGAVFSSNKNEADAESNKRQRSSFCSSGGSNSNSNSSSSLTDSARPVVLVDSQETGVRLVHTLMACAEAVQQENFNLADALVRHIGILAVSQSGAMRKVATYFAEALARRIYKIYPQDSIETSYTDVLQLHFYETCPYLKFAHFTANQAILEAFTNCNKVHVIDFSLKQGMQWPALMQALALRPGGPPAFRLTGIGPPQPDNTDTLQQVGWKLAQLADTIGVEFEFRGFVANSLADLDASMLDIRPTETEAVAVNSVFELHQLLSRPGAIEKVLQSIKQMNPKIITLVEQEANHNADVFINRFNEALHYYSTMFDSLESSSSSLSSLSSLSQPPVTNQDLVMSEVYLGRQICNVVACEGPDRVERHESLNQWRVRMNSAGFDPVHLGSNAFKQASMLLALFAGGDGYRVEENDGCLMLGWHTRPLIATSAWRITAEDGGAGAGEVELH